MQTAIAFLLFVRIFSVGVEEKLSHSETIDPDFELVFPQHSVNRIDIFIEPSTWQIMMDDMTELFGEFGAALHSTGFRPPLPPEGASTPPLVTAGNPVWAESCITFSSEEWQHVGFRFKGNSSLADTWRSGVLKLPFKLDFDQFEDEFPETDNQRFFGFKQLTFSSNFMDSSLLREKVTADIFRAAGVAAPHAAFYQVFIDHGEGPVYFGLYTAVEVVDDTVIEEQFPDDSGNVYKPEGRGATFAAGFFSEESFDKETNREEEDWSDVMQLYSVLHSDMRTTDQSAWAREIEDLFDVDAFLIWLAVNVIVQNWDTYGRAPHNYYLYNDPITDLLTWIPWDNNMALCNDVGLMPVHTLSLEDVGSDWPLIRYLLDVPEYRRTYLRNLEMVVNSSFKAEALSERYRELHDLIRPYVSQEIPGYTLLNHPSDFDSALEKLVEHAFQRSIDVDAFLSACH